jgi:hypothetical protein
MRSIVVATVLSILCALAWFGYVQWRARELNEFCSSLPKGWTVVQVREAAQEKGFTPTMEPFAQMRIEASRWHFSAKSCRVFFNRARTVEYRIWQGS